MRNVRKALTPVLEITALVLVLLDLGLGAGMVWLSHRLADQRRIQATAKVQIQQLQMRVAKLQTYDDFLPGAKGKVNLFIKERIPNRRQGYSRALHLLRILTQDSGVQLTAVGYPRVEIEKGSNAPLDRLSLNISVAGTFDSLMKFSHELETATEFIVLRDFALQPGDNSQLNLRITADLYMNP